MAAYIVKKESNTAKAVLCREIGYDTGTYRILGFYTSEDAANEAEMLFRDLDDLLDRVHEVLRRHQVYKDDYVLAMREIFGLLPTPYWTRGCHLEDKDAPNQTH